MEVPDSVSEELGVALQLRLLWERHPNARLVVERLDEGAYRASVTLTTASEADAHSQTAIHALSRALAHVGLDNDLTRYP